MQTPDFVTEEKLRGYVDFVYAAVMRQVGNEATALDVTQAVFLVMTRKRREGKLPEEKFMLGWLLRVTRYGVKEARRAATRRGYHERKAAVDAAPVEQRDEADAARIRGELDEALMELGAVDREVVMRRYLGGESIADVGRAVGMTENTAGRRIGRALEKLRSILSGRGVRATDGAMLGVMACEFQMKSPQLAMTVLKGAGAPGTATVIADAVLKKVAIMKITAAVLTGVMILAAGAGITALGIQLLGRVDNTVPVATTGVPLTVEGRVRANWESMAAIDDLEQLRGAVGLSSYPVETVAFLKKEMKAVNLDAAEARNLIANLGSDKEEVWGPAVARLRYDDPRMAIGLEELFRMAREEPARGRMLELISNGPPGFPQMTVTLEKENGRYFFQRQGGTRERWEVMADVSNIYNPLWKRAENGMLVLAEIGTPEAIAIVREMSAGHADASPTKFAKKILEDVEKRGDVKTDMGKDWEALKGYGPEMVRAAMRLARRPAETVAFLKPRLVPLNLTEEELKKLTAALSSEKEEVWRAAFEKLEYQDPRLAMDAGKIMDQVTEPRARGHMGELLTGAPAGACDGLTITLERHRNGDYSMKDGKAVRYIQSRIDSVERPGKARWVQAERGIVLLGSVGSKEAVNILRSIAEGNPGAEPTQVAWRELERLGAK